MKLTRKIFVKPLHWTSWKVGLDNNYSYLLLKCDFKQMTDGISMIDYDGKREPPDFKQVIVG